MAKMLREYATCWVRHEPDLEVGLIQLVPAELSDISVEIARARKYDSEASISLIERLCSAVNTETDIDDRLLKFIAEALQVLIQDEKPNLSGFAQTLGIKHKANRPAKEKRDQKIFFEVREHMFSMTLEEACSRVAGTRFLSEERINSIYKERRRNHLEFLREMDDFSHEVTKEDLIAIQILLEKDRSDE